MDSSGSWLGFKPKGRWLRRLGSWHLTAQSTEAGGVVRSQATFNFYKLQKTHISTASVLEKKRLGSSHLWCFFQSAHHLSLCTRMQAADVSFSDHISHWRFCFQVRVTLAAAAAAVAPSTAPCFLSFTPLKSGWHETDSGGMKDKRAHGLSGDLLLRGWAA